MTMPEATIHETDGSEPAEDQVRRSRKLPIVKTVPEAARMQRAAKDQLGFVFLPPIVAIIRDRTVRSTMSVIG